MPTISQLPAATSIAAADQLPISQGGSVRAVSVGRLLAATQPAILIDSSALLGRTSLGPGAPEQVAVGRGITFSNGMLSADGADHATFLRASDLALEADVVISNRGTPMLIQASLLRGLFSAGQSISIDPQGVISITSTDDATGIATLTTAIPSRPVITSIDPHDLITVNRSGSDKAITYQNLLGGVTIDQAAGAGPANDADTIWVAQGSNVMMSQSFSAIWTWISRNLCTYKSPVVELTANTSLDTTVHNGRFLVCSQPITLTPLLTNMGSGFQCSVMNASSGDITLGPGFISSNGRLLLSPWQSAILSCVTYSGGTFAFAAMPSAASAIALPGQVGGLTGSAATSTTITLSWQAPSGAGPVLLYNLLYRTTGTTAWSGHLSLTGVTGCQITALQAATSYDFVVSAQNSAGIGPASTLLTIATLGVGQTTVPGQVSNLTANPTSNNAVDLAWTAQTGVSAATSYTIQYRITGTTAWLPPISGVTAPSLTISGLRASTSYDFSIFGVTAAGNGPISAIVSATTPTAPPTSIAITWNLWPTGSYTHGTGSIGVNAHVSPATSAIQFGFSLSSSASPLTWTAATPVNADLWGAYVPTPATAGSWYAWAEGIDGNARIVHPTPFVVQ